MSIDTKAAGSVPKAPTSAGTQSHPRAGAGSTSRGGRGARPAVNTVSAADLHLVLVAVQESARDALALADEDVDESVGHLVQSIELAIEAARPMAGARSPELSAVMRTTLSEIERAVMSLRSMDSGQAAKIQERTAELREVFAARGVHVAQVGFPKQELDAADRGRMVELAVEIAASVATRHATSIKRVEKDGVAAAAAASASELAPALTHILGLIDVGGDQVVHADLAVPLASLSDAIGTIFTEARAAKVSQRDSGLELLFDVEDALLLAAHAASGRRDRATLYYDENLTDPKAGSSLDPGADTDHLLKGGDRPDTGGPRTRDSLVTEIVSFSHRLAAAFKNANKSVEQVVTEAPRPRDPSSLELLIMMAADAAFVGLSAVVATQIRSVSNARNDVVSVEQKIAAERRGAPSNVHVPDASRRMLSETEIEVLREYAKDATKRQGKSAANFSPGKQTEPPSPASEPSRPSITDGLGFQSRYLLALHERTNGLVADVEQRFELHEPALRRLPVDDLEAVAAALSDTAAKAIGDAYADAAIVEWANLVARATHDDDDGALVLNRRMYGPEAQPLGAIRVDVSREGGALRIRRATLDMPNDAAVDALNGMAGTLGALPVYRMLVVEGHYSEQRWMVSPDHRIEGIEGNTRPDGIAGIAHEAETQQLKDLLDAYPTKGLVSV